MLRGLLGTLGTLGTPEIQHSRGRAGKVMPPESRVLIRGYSAAAVPAMAHT